MKVLKIMFGLVLLGVLGYVGLSVATNRGMVQASYLEQVNGQLKNVRLPNLNGATQVIQQAEETVANQEVMTSVEVKTGKPPITQQAFEYVRYNYCKAVVSDYVARYESNN